MSTKMFVALLVLVTVSVVFVEATDSYAPVILWNINASALKKTAQDPGVSPFGKMESAEFEKYLKDNIEPNTAIVVFYRSELCIEDLTQHNSKLQPLNQMGIKYMPQVESPYEVLNNLATHNQTHPEPGEFIMNGQIGLREIENLDDVVKTYQSFSDLNPNIVGILTGSRCKFERVKREIKEDTNSTNLIVSDTNVLMYSKDGFSIMTDGKEYQQLGPHYLANVTGNGTEATPIIILINFMSSNTNTNTRMRMVIYSEFAGYWSLKQIDVDDTVLNISSPSVVFPQKFSYHCSENIVFRDLKKPNFSIMLNDLQLEIFEGKNPQVFSDPYDCVGFVTIPILTGLFVTLIFGLIITWGLSMVLNIKTMDRLDDPKGKTITIFANE